MVGMDKCTSLQYCVINYCFKELCGTCPRCQLLSCFQVVNLRIKHPFTVRQFFQLSKVFQNKNSKCSRCLFFRVLSVEISPKNYLTSTHRDNSISCCCLYVQVVQILQQFFLTATSHVDVVIFPLRR